jgi:hypothetical protein
MLQLPERRPFRRAAFGYGRLGHVVTVDPIGQGRASRASAELRRVLADSLDLLVGDTPTPSSGVRTADQEVSRPRGTCLRDHAGFPLAGESR